MRDDHQVEVKPLTPHRAFAVHEPSQVGEVRRTAAALAESVGFDAVAAGRVALIATELGTNLVKHAQGGQLLLAPVQGEDGRTLVELLSLDNGPGISNVARSMADGYSTTGTLGGGLGAVQRQAQEFDLYSRVPEGTVILARVGPTTSPFGGGRTNAAVEVGAVVVCAPGETVCGDAWTLKLEGLQASLMVVDGLGHGPVAGEAAMSAVAAFADQVPGSPAAMIERLHQALRSTRGAAVAIAEADLQSRRILYAGAGNIAGRLLSGHEDRSLLSQHGTVGLAVRRQQDMAYDWPAHALLLMHSDGITSRWHLDDDRALLQHHPSVVAGWVLRNHSRGRDDATVVVLRVRGD